MSKRISIWLVWGWLVATIIDSFLPSNPFVYRADPFSSAILISLAISAATTAANVGLQYLIASKQKVAPIDRGKMDDIRISTAGYGEFVPKGWGVFRVAPIWFWGTPIVHSTITTPGTGGGKGSPSPATPGTIEHVYTKTIAGVFHDGPLFKGVQRIWFDTDLVYNGLRLGSGGPSGGSPTVPTRKYEGEFGALAGGAVVAVQAECSGGKKVRLIGLGGTCTLTVTAPTTGNYDLAIHYTSTAQRTFKVSVNGGANVDVVCDSTGGAGIVGIETLTPVALTAGANTIAFSNAGAYAPDLDYIDFILVEYGSGGGGGVIVRPPPIFTGAIDINKVPATDQDASWSYSNAVPEMEYDTGIVSTNLSKYGQPAIRIYRGTATQTADPAIVADKGAANTSAYRGFGYLVIEGLQLQNGRIPNVTVECNQGVRSVAAIVEDIYELVGVAATNLNLSALSGLLLGDTDFNPGTFSAITWVGEVNATPGAGGAISKTSGATNTWNSYANTGVTLSAGTNAAIKFTASAGTFMIGFGSTFTPGSTLPNPYNQTPFAVLLNLNSVPSQVGKNAIQMSLGGSNNTVDVGVWAPGDIFQVEIRNGRFQAFQNGIELVGFTPPVPTFPLYPMFLGYGLGGGVTAASYASGANVGDEPEVATDGGLLLSSRSSAAQLLENLQTRFQFDMVEVDGVVKAVLRNGTSDITIPYAELRAHNDGDEMPPYDCLITDIDPLLLPKRVDVNYLDPNRDYHNNVQSDLRLVGPQYDEQSVSLAIVDSPDNMKKLATVLLYKPEQEGRGFKFTTGYKYQRVHPGSVATLTLPNATHVVRVTEARYQLPAGICEFEAVRQTASLYSPSGVGVIGEGFEAPIVASPGNTKGVIIDGPVLRPEDAGDGSQIVVYVGMSGRGAGTWPGGHLYQEFPRGTDNYEYITSSSLPSAIGVSTNTLATVANTTLFDTASTITVNFYSNRVLSSATQAQLQANKNLNLIWVGRNGTGEYLQFRTATALSPAAPYLKKYTLTGFYRGRFGTSPAGHLTGDDVVLMDSTIKPRRLEFGDVGASIKWKFVTVGQNSTDVTPIVQKLNGASRLTVGSLSPVITFDGKSLVHTLATAPVANAAKFQISRVNNPATFADTGNLIWEGTSLKWSDSQLFDDPRKATRYFRAIGRWHNPPTEMSTSAIAPASYDVTAPQKPIITVFQQGPGYTIFNVKSPEAVTKRQTFLTTTWKASKHSDFAVANILGSGSTTAPKVSDTVQVRVSKPAGVSNIWLRAFFTDMFGDGLTGQFNPATRTNFALAVNGGVATASSTRSSAYPASSVINGDRKGLNYATGGVWLDISVAYPDWVQVDFNGTKLINEIDVFSVQDNSAAPIEPTLTTTCSLNCLIDFLVQYWNGAAWVTVTGGTVTGNNKVWRQFKFTAVSTTKVRVNITSAGGNRSRLVELEAWGG